MRMRLAVMLAFLPLMQAQDSQLLKSVEPNYSEYSDDLATDFVEANGSVTLTVADGKPLALVGSSLPLPMAVVMALKEYEFQRNYTVPHGRPATEGRTYEVKLQVPVRQRKDPLPLGNGAIAVNPGVAAASIIRQPKPQYPEIARHNRIQGRISFEAVIGTDGYIESLMVNHGHFVLIEAAYAAIQQWQYRPTIVNGEPVQVLTEIQFNFTLN